MRKTFIPVYPWRDCDAKWVLVNNEYIPSAHAMQMLGLSKDAFFAACGALFVKFYKNSEVASTPIGCSYSSYIHIKSFPAIMKHIGLSDEMIEEGMKTFQHVAARTRGGSTRRNRPKQNDDGDDDDDDEVLFPPSVEIELPPSPVVQRPKRNREEKVEPPQEVQGALNRMEALFAKSMDMLGDQALVTYVKTDMWTNKLQKALKDEVAKELPSLRSIVKQELRAHYEPIIKEQIRKDYEDKLQNDNVEADAFHNVLHKKRFQTLAAPPPPTSNPPKGGFDSPPPPPGDGFDASVWVQAFLQSDKTE